MGTSQADKAASHERITDAAAVQIRRGGVGSLNVASLMSDAGLTHGGFYRHFASRDALITEAVETALEQSADGYRSAKSPDGQRAARSLDDVIDDYLSPPHRDDPGSGCAIAALGNDIARGNEDARAAYTRHVRGYLDRLTAAMARSSGEAGDAPYVTLAAMVGALVLARAVSDPTLSDELLSRTARGLRDVTEGTCV
jgi:TetR/AcrR family transcriptional repressor of nem operon